MAKAYYILNSGSLKRKENTILFKNQEVTKYIPVEDVEELFIFGEVSINTKVINFLAQNGIPVHFFNYYGLYTGSLYPRETNVSGYLLIKQVEHYLDYNSRLFLAKSFIEGAIRNLSYVSKLDPSESLKNLSEAQTIEEVMSVEANFRKKFYKFLETETGWEFGERSKRPPQNPLNALISFGNSLVYAKVLGEIYYTQLNPTVSYLHEPSTKRFSLSLDIAEIFKPILSDYLILKLIREKKITEEHFVKELNYAYLNPEGRHIFISEFDNLIKSTINHRKLKRKVSKKQLIRLELYKLIRHLIGEDTYRPLIYNSL